MDVLKWEFKILCSAFTKLMIILLCLDLQVFIFSEYTQTYIVFWVAQEIPYIL